MTERHICVSAPGLPAGPGRARATDLALAPPDGLFTFGGELAVIDNRHWPDGNMA